MMNPFDPAPDDSFFCLSNLSRLEDPGHKEEIKKSVSLIEEFEKVNFCLIEIILVDNEKIREINKKYLNHDFVTDVITFPYDVNQEKHSLEGTLYCGIERVIEQADELNTAVETEYYRVIIHGLLHLCGYDDDTDTNCKHMRNRENFYLEKMGFSVT